MEECGIEYAEIRCCHWEEENEVYNHDANSGTGAKRPLTIGSVEEIVRCDFVSRARATAEWRRHTTEGDDNHPGGISYNSDEDQRDEACDELARRLPVLERGALARPHHRDEGGGLVIVDLM